MKKIHKLMNHPTFIQNMNMCEEAEKSREFCKHGLQHCLDVARIFYILVLENAIRIDKELVYAAALLHDIGRAKQYEENLPHNVIGAELAAAIMMDIGFKESDIKIVKGIILNHCSNVHNSDSIIEELFYKADFLSRNCFECQAVKECKWNIKNELVSY